MRQRLLRFCSACLLAGIMIPLRPTAALAEAPRWAIALHGGAGNLSKEISPERLDEYKRGLEQALTTGEAILAKGGTALDAVEQTVITLENDPRFNAGCGGVFNAEGAHQLDASIMDGKTLDCGGVAAVKSVRNPIRAARRVMEKTPHLLLAAQDADDFAAAQGLEAVPQSAFFDQTRWDQFNRWRKEAGKPELDEPPYGWPKAADGSPKAADGSPRDRKPASGDGEDGGNGDHDIPRGTVGCVALDQHGNLAAATSTGGLTGKLPGRVGDSPIIGAGTYADNAGCAVSGTGRGEEFIRHAIAFQINWRVREGKQSLDQAVRDCLETVLKPDDGGLIAVDRQGNLIMRTNTRTLNRAWADSAGNRGIAIWDKSFDD